MEFEVKEEAAPDGKTRQEIETMSLSPVRVVRTGEIRFSLSSRPVYLVSV
jgi:hypothetical protein